MFILENNQLLPFERNRYYIGKLLTSADFQTEQTYFNNKRRFINGLMFGSGIVCGMGVYNLDDLSIMVESGVAVDGMGREIVLESSVVKKLSVLEGFENLTTDNATLCLRYAEEEVHPVYAVNRQEQTEDYEFNRIKEGWQLFLLDTHTLGEKENPISEILITNRMYSDSDFSVDISMPASVACGSMVKLTMVVEKRSDENKSFSMESILQTPAFINNDGSHELKLQFKDIILEKGEKAVKEYWLTAQQQEVKDTILIAKGNFTEITIGGKGKHLVDNFIMKISVVNTDTDSLVAKEIGKMSLESRSLSGTNGFIQLAEFTLQRIKNSYFIEAVREEGIKSYIHTPAAEEMRKSYGAYFKAANNAIDSTFTGTAKVEEEKILEYKEPVYASGICEISLGANPKKGDIVFSDEIMHGLGKGNVYVEVGFEYIMDDPKLMRTAKTTVYGDPELFKAENLPITCAKTAVKVMNDRGSFVVAAQLTEDTNYVLLTLKWVAVKLPAGDDSSTLKLVAGKSIDAVQPTVVMATRESHYFTVRFKNMEPCALAYELTDKDSGSITSDGIYTAPAKEGVYEIRIFCSDMPFISTYAYAIVKKKDAEEEGIATKEEN